MSFALSFNGLNLNTNNNILVTRLAGVDGLPIISDGFKKPLADGALLGGQYYDGRTIIIGGAISASSADDYFTARRALLSAFQKDVTSDLSFTTWESTPVTRAVSCKVIGTPQITEASGNITTNRWSVELFAEDPFFLSSSTTSETINLPITGGLDLPADLPADFSGGGGGSATINNGGDVFARPTYTITAGAPLISPRVTNLSTGDTFVINETLSSGDVIVVSKTIRSLSVTKNGVNALNLLLGDYINLQVGINVISFTAGSYDASSTLNVSFRERYNGI